MIKNLELRIKNIKNKVEKYKKPKIACIEWINPLMAAGNWIPEMIHISGGEDIFGKKGKDSHWIEFNEINKLNPDIIIFIPCGFDLKKTNDEVKDLLKLDTSWHDLKAFKNKKLFITDGNQYFNRPGPRLVDSLEIFAEIIHPELFNFQHQNKGWINFFNN